MAPVGHRGRVTQPAPPAPTTTSAAWRYRKYLLLPIIPLAAIVLMVVGGLTLALLPNGVATVALLGSYAYSLYHAARRGRAGWVVAIALIWPVLVGYWIWVGLGLDRSAV